MEHNGVELYHIPFTQYLLPDGRKKQIYFATTDQELIDKAQLLLSHGLLFEAEVLRNGMVSLTIFDTESDIGDVAIELCNNGNQVLDAVKMLIMEYNHER